MTTSTRVGLRIGIDASELLDTPTGVGRYLRELLGQWLESGTSPHEFILYAPTAAGHQHSLSEFSRHAGVLVRPVRGRAGFWWQQWALRRAVVADRPDVFFAPAYTAPPWLPIPVVLAIHDASFAAHPEWFSWRTGLRLRGLSRLAGADARIVTLTRFSRDEIVEHLGLASDSIEVVTPGVSRRFAGAGPADVRQPVVLFVGSILTRRHVPDLIQAFAVVARRRPDAHLTIVGPNRSEPFIDPCAIAEAAGLGDRVTVTDFVSDDDLTALYRSARAFAFLSSYEGFALTPLEALAAGVPGVLLDTRVAREVYGPSAIYVDEGDILGTASALERLIYDDEARAAVLQSAPRTLARYDWAQAARQLLRVFEEATE